MVYTDFLKAAESGRWERGCLFYGAEEYLTVSYTHLTLPTILRV